MQSLGARAPQGNDLARLVEDEREERRNAWSFVKNIYKLRRFANAFLRCARMVWQVGCWEMAIGVPFGIEVGVTPWFLEMELSWSISRCARLCLIEFMTKANHLDIVTWLA
jgi:hypothetical protein